ncbi:MAG: NmrA/HSCARG family protein [Roseiflexaceae bacterium]
MATNSPLKVLIYGATGAQSGALAPELLRRGHQPYVFTRNPEKAAGFAQAGATVVAGDMADRGRLVEASTGMDAVALLIPFFVPNPADALAFGRNAIDAAREAGVRLIVWNTSGAIPPVRTGNPSIDLRIDIAEHLRASGVPHIILQPLVYAENLLGPWTAPFVAQQDLVAYPTPPDLRIAWIPAADVAALVAAALERPELAGRSYVVSGTEAPDGPELAEHFAAALGRPISYHALPPREFGAILDRVFGPGAGDAAATEYERQWASPERKPMAADMAPVLADLPVRLRTLREWVAEHAAAFTPQAVETV